jgi:hypothetical protein
MDPGGVAGRPGRRRGDNEGVNTMRTGLTMEAAEKADLMAVEGGLKLSDIVSQVNFPVALQSNSLVNVGGNAFQGQNNGVVAFGSPTTIL